jgi:hypothetical protein
MLFDAGGIFWLVLTVICAFFALICFAGVKEDGLVPLILGLFLLVLTGLFVMIVFFWRPADHRAQQQAVADLKRQGYVTQDASTKTNTVTVLAGKCSFSYGLHKIKGVWEPTVPKKYHVPFHQPVTVNTPVPVKYIKQASQLPLCRK